MDFTEPCKLCVTSKILTNRVIKLIDWEFDWFNFQLGWHLNATNQYLNAADLWRAKLSCLSPAGKQSVTFL